MDHKVILKAAHKEFGKHPGVNGVFVGLRNKGGKWTDEVTVQFHVDKKKPLSKLSEAELLPPSFSGLRTDVIESRAVPATSFSLPFPFVDRKRSAIQGGVSMGIEEQTNSGTLGLVFISEEAGVCGITCAHVVLRLVSPTYAGVNVLHPSIDDGGIIGTDRFGTVVYCGMIGPSPGPDVAFIQIERPYGLSMINTDMIMTTMRDPDLNDVVRKTGRTTGTTDAKVQGMGSMGVDYSAWGLGTVSFNMVSLIPAGDDPNEITVAGGDSGSVWYYPGTTDGMGLVTSVSTSGIISYAQLLSNVFLYSPLIPNTYHSEIKGAFNVRTVTTHEIKGSLNLSGTGPLVITRLTAINQDTTQGYDPIEDILEAHGITFEG
jgi:hypothetical protein